VTAIQTHDAGVESVGVKLVVKNEIHDPPPSRIVLGPQKESAALADAATARTQTA
jgi:hypothetical protein